MYIYIYICVRSLGASEAETVAGAVHASASDAGMAGAGASEAGMAGACSAWMFPFNFVRRERF